MIKNDRGGVADVLLVALFAGALLAPAADSQFFHISSKLASTENRNMASKPLLRFKNFEEAKDFPKAYETYFNDNFGFRNLLVRAGSRFKLFYMKISPVPLVIVGKNGWYYYYGDRGYDGVPVAGYRGITRYSEKNLELIKRNLESQKKWLEDQGIRYVILIAPSKATIYPEYMPDTIQVVNRQSRTDQLVDYLEKTNAGMRVLDVREELRRAKKNYPVYYKTDHHWNRYGAFLAAQAITRELGKYFPGVEPFSIDDYEVTVEKLNAETDLSNLLAMPKQLDDDEVLLEFKPKSLKTAFSYRRPYPKILFFRESFGNALLPFLQDHFKNIVDRRWEAIGLLDYGVVTQLKPDAVVVEIEESYQGALQ